MMRELPALEALVFDWGDAYLLSYVRDRWVALRRDRRRFLVADTLTGLERLIQDDYRRHPVSRDCDPPGTADYLSLDAGDMAGDGDVPDEDTEFILAALRCAFPSWTITCSPQLRAWLARAGGKTICLDSPVLLCAALTLIERRQPPGRHGPVP
jgi:hypothetical protein